MCTPLPASPPHPEPFIPLAGAAELEAPFEESELYADELRAFFRPFQAAAS